MIYIDIKSEYFNLLTVKKYIPISVMILFLTIIACNQTSNKDQREKKLTNTSVNGIYKGLEEICWTDSTGRKECFIDPTNSESKWYHLGILKIKGDSAFLDQNPVSINNEDTSYSASDGGFYYYKGTTNIKDSVVSISLEEVLCDYCASVKISAVGGTIKQMSFES